MLVAHTPSTRHNFIVTATHDLYLAHPGSMVNLNFCNNHTVASFVSIRGNIYQRKEKDHGRMKILYHFSCQLKTCESVFKEKRKCERPLTNY